MIRPFARVIIKPQGYVALGLFRVKDEAATPCPAAHSTTPPPPHQPPQPHPHPKRRPGSCRAGLHPPSPLPRWCRRPLGTRDTATCPPCPARRPTAASEQPLQGRSLCRSTHPPRLRRGRRWVPTSRSETLLSSVEDTTISEVTRRQMRDNNNNRTYTLARYNLP